MRRPAVIPLVCLAGLLLVSPTVAPAAASPGSQAVTRAGSKDTLAVGSLVLERCDVLPRAFCGELPRRWNPRVPGSLGVGFALVPAKERPALGTLVPHEGGPGYSTTGSASLYTQMYGGLLRRRNLLLVDQRGTGLSRPVDCPALQTLPTGGAYAPAAELCAAKLGDHANLYGSALSADDLAAVVRALGLGPIDLYGDSYGTFFAQVFAGRHGDLIRSLVLDSAYPPTGETMWYPTQGPALRRSVDIACERTPTCAAAGASTTQLLRRVLSEVRRTPYRGIAGDADGVRRKVVVDAEALVTVAFGATYGPASYRELPGALRSALAGDRAPLVRLTAESLFGGSAGDPVDYSEGLDAAVSCHDYPQLYDMTAPPSRRPAQYEAAIRRQESQDPSIYGPFTIREYLASDWQFADWCLRWPVAPAAHPAGPPAPPSGHYPDLPTLVLSGELDTITTPAEGAMSAAQFPRAEQVLVANSFHVTAMGDIDHCAVRIVRRFVADLETATGCADRVPPLRAVAAYARSFRQPGGDAAAEPGPARDRRLAAVAAADTAADMLDRWFNNYSGTGVGLYGGTWSYTGDSVVRFRLHGVRLAADLAIGGTVRWARFGHTLGAHLRVREVSGSGAVVAGSPVNGWLTGSWDTRAFGARAHLTGRLGGRAFHLTLPAP